MSTMPVWWASNAVQSTEPPPSAIFTPRTSSSTVTPPLPSQSPVHGSVAGGGVGLGVGEGVGLSVPDAVEVGLAADVVAVAVGAPSGGLKVAVGTTVSAVGVIAALAVRVALYGAVSVGVGVAITLTMAVADDVGVCVGVEDDVGVALVALDGVGVAVTVGVRVSAGRMIAVMVFDVVQPYASVAITTKTYVPAALGVPRRRPADDSVNPGGGDDRVASANVCGGVPPVADSISW